MIVPTLPMSVSLDALPQLARELSVLRERILANVVMMGEIPAPTFGEQNRITFLQDRFIEGGLHDVMVDDVGNGLARLPGSVGAKSILVFAHVDTPFPGTVDHTMHVTQEAISGPGVGDNVLGLATVASLPFILERLGVTFKHDLILMGDVRSLGRGNIAGMRTFLENNKRLLHGGICVEGVQLGRLSYASPGMLRAEVRCSTGGGDELWPTGLQPGAIGPLMTFIDGLMALPELEQPGVSLILGSVSGGTAYNTTAAEARLAFEVRGRDEGSVATIEQSISALLDACCGEQGDQCSCSIAMDVLARRSSGGIDERHPIVSSAKAAMGSLNIAPCITPTTGSASALIDAGIPCVVLGLTEGRAIHELHERIMIDPIFTGIAQLLSVMLAMDNDYGQSRD